jgi:demethylmenaquinone methyltransferase / 2-methoxy-6-polyprenyl-1,4-benzoquinol methylase
MDSHKKNASSGSITVTPYGDKKLTKKQEIALMFDNISGKYDVLNGILSLGIHKGWRIKAVKELKANANEHLLDIATGTGAVAILANSVYGCSVTGIDISTGMLDEARKKLKEFNLESAIKLMTADSEKMPFANNTFNCAIVAFGVRNFENLSAGLNEIYRVIKPGSKFVVLEFSKPSRFPVKQLYSLYSSVIVPSVGRIISKDKSAYSYLPESVKAFPDGEDFLGCLRKAGFKNTVQKQLTFGIASIYTGIK